MPEVLNNQPLNVQLGYNQTHLGGAGDLFESYFPAADQYDLDTILDQLHSELTTRKVLIVGHSQGAVYANKIYEYLVTHGEPKESVAVYAVATPDSYVAGGGKYRNFALDHVLNDISVLPRFELLPYNLSAADYVNSNGESTDPNNHALVGTYFALFADKIIPDINTELWLLKAEPSAVTDGCFVPPEATPVHAFEQGAFTTADPLALGVKSGFETAGALLGAAGNLASSGYGAIAGLFGGAGGTATSSALQEKKEAAATFTFLNALNLTSLTGKDAADLLGDGQGGAAILALQEQDVPRMEAGDEVEASTTPDMLNATTTPPDAPGVSTSTVSMAITSTSSLPLIPPPLPVVAPIPGEGGGGGGASVVDAGSDASGSASSTDTTATSTDIDIGTDATSTPPEATSTPLALTAPPNVTFSNWGSPPITDDYCDVMHRTADVSWDPVPGATEYQLWEDDSDYGDRDVLDTAATSTVLDFLFGLNWSRQITLKVVATDGAGQYATTTLSANNALPDKDSPIISSVIPTYGSKDVPLSTPLQLVYSEALNPSTVTSTSVVLSHIFSPMPVTGPLWEPVAADVSLEADGKTVDIVPQSALLPGQSYSLGASCRVKDLYGNHAGPLTSPTYNPQFMTATTT